MLYLSLFVVDFTSDRLAVYFKFGGVTLYVAGGVNSGVSSDSSAGWPCFYTVVCQLSLISVRQLNMVYSLAILLL